MVALAEDDAVALGDALRAAAYADAGGIVGGSAGATLRRLFSIGSSAARTDATAALGDRLVDALAEARILEPADDGRVRAAMRVTALEGLLFLHDRPVADGAPDQVAAVGPASATLAKLMVRTPAARTLDLGTGCGVQALLAARFSEQVVATDLSERALAVAAVNTHLNRVGNVELRRGDLFAPVAGETFDRIVANPPFVISPETSHVYRDSTLAGDEVSRTVVEQAARHLAPGGHATVLCEWILRGDERWDDVPRRWAAGLGCDVLALHYRTATPEDYATGWNTPLRTADPDAYVAAVERWTAYQQELGARAVSTGAIALRRRTDGAARFVAEEMPHGPQGVAGAHVLRMLDDPPDRDLADAVLEPADGQVLTQLLVRRDGAWTTPDVDVTLEAGAGIHATIAPALVHVLLSLDGERPLGAVAEQAAAELGADPAALRRDAVAMAARLLAVGLCTVSGPRD